jgi:hypothetical protein
LAQVAVAVRLELAAVMAEAQPLHIQQRQSPHPVAMAELALTAPTIKTISQVMAEVMVLMLADKMSGMVAVAEQDLLVSAQTELISVDKAVTVVTVVLQR